MRLAALCLVAASLSGCLDASQYRLVTDTLSAFNRPRQLSPDVTSRLRQSNVASQILTLEDTGSQVPLILVDQSAGRDHYASPSGELASFSQGRLVDWSGLGVQLTWLDARPAPAAALSSPQPSCWRAAFRVHGELVATRVVAEGCLQPAAVPDAQGLRRVLERWTIDGQPAAWTNEYLFQGREVVRSTQHLGPGLPALQLEAIRLAPAATDITPAYPVLPAASHRVRVTVSGLAQADASSAPDLLSLQAPWRHLPGVDWQASRLYRLDALGDRAARLDRVRQQLAAHALAARQAGQPARATAWVHLQAQLAKCLPAAAIPLMNPVEGIAFPDRVPVLTGTRYHLVLRGVVRSAPVRGSVHLQALPLAGSQPLRALLAPQALRAEADAEVWRMRPGQPPSRWLFDQTLGDRHLIAADTLVVLPAALEPAFAADLRDTLADCLEPVNE